MGLGGVLARHRGIPSIELIAVEALPARFKLLQLHLRTNGLCFDKVADQPEGLACRLFDGAATRMREDVFFPDVGITDMGAAVNESARDRDYRGKQVRNLRVQGYPLSEILGDGRVDLLHIDVQGSEFDLIEGNLDLLGRQVDAMMVGTHSRVIEGNLIDLLYQNGWYLELEKPCRVGWVARPVSQESMTETDGCQYWRRLR